MKKLNTLLLLLAAAIASAQSISGTVKSREDQRAVPFAKIGIEGTNAGTNADGKGNYSLDISGADKNSILKIGAAGFEDFKIKLGDFEALANHNILLIEKVRPIEEVHLRPKKYKLKNIGIKNGSKRFLFGFNSSHKSDALKEMAVLMENKSVAKIQKVNFQIGRIASAKPIIISIEFYCEKNGFPDRIIETDPILYTADSKKIGDVSLNIDDRNISIKGNFFVSVRIVNELDGQFYLTSNIFALSKSTFQRNFYSSWTELKYGAPALNIDVKVEK